MADNRRRIKPELLGEIEGHEGDTFTEQLLNWNRKQDTLSQSEELIDQLRDTMSDDGEGIDYTHIENVIEKHADRVIEQLGGRR